MLQGKEVFPLSDAQKLLLWAEVFSFEPKKVKESNIIAFYIKVPYDEAIAAQKMADMLEGALNEVIRSNDSLRLRIIKTRKGKRQYVADHVHYVPERINVDGEEGLQKFLSGLDRYPIGWYDERLILAKTLILNAHQCAIMVRIHHAVFDGYSIALFAEQFEAAYNAIKKGETPQPPARIGSVVEYFKDNAQYLASPQHKADRKFWFNTYNHQRKYSFPAGYRSESGDCAECFCMLEGELYTRLAAKAKECSCSLPSLLMTMAALTTYVLTGKENFCIYSLSHGRRKFTLRKAMGCMMNTVPIFYDIKMPDEPVAALIENSYINYMDTFSHARLGMGEQVPLSYKEPILHGFNFNHGWLLFSVMDYGATLAESSLEMHDLPMLNQPLQFYATILEVPGEHVNVGLQYQTAKYNAAQVEHILDTLKKVCTMVVEDDNVTPRMLYAALGKKKKKR